MELNRLQYGMSAKYVCEIHYISLVSVRLTSTLPRLNCSGGYMLATHRGTKLVKAEFSNYGGNTVRYSFRNVNDFLFISDLNFVINIRLKFIRL